MTDFQNTTPVPLPRNAATWRELAAELQALAVAGLLTSRPRAEHVWPPSGEYACSAGPVDLELPLKGTP